ncbi:MAG: hypothetical protein QOD69_124 [Solirubrobacteraceae bacterium]|jgi:hypothetical protein|nr:hypothetical protein [Solirubrobacteraceae bacterium]
MPPQRTRLALITVALVGLLPAAAVAAPATYAPAKRPHSRVATYDRGEVLVRRLQLQLTRTNHRLRGVVRLTVRNETGHAIERLLRVGSCTGGAPAAPVCRSELTVRVRIPAHVDVPVTRRVTLHQPPPGVDSVQAALVTPRARQPYVARRTDANLLLRGTAWRGAGAGRVYGANLQSDDARRLYFDIPATSRGRAYIDVKWTGPAAPSAATTTISRCTGAGCTGATLHPTRSRSGPQTFGQRFDYEIRGADSVGLSAATAAAPLLEAALPWPG